MLTAAFKSLFETNMGVCRGERILVFSDTIRPDETVTPDDLDRRIRLQSIASQAADYAATTYGNTTFSSFPSTTASGAEPPEAVWLCAFGNNITNELSADGLLERLLSKRANELDLKRAMEVVSSRKDEVVDVIVALSNNSTSHTRFRALVNAAGGRFASLPNFDPEMFFSSMRVDWAALAKRTSVLAGRVNEAVEILIETANGTRMRLNKQGRTAEGDDGLLTAPGSFGNLPAGEVYLAPVEGTGEGLLVIEFAPTRKLASPLELVVEKGMVVDIRGDEPYREKLEKKFAESDKNRNIAELGIGTNDRATRPDNILEAEKILGTIHIALGDNSGFGGTVSTPFHEDYVFYQPTVTAILSDGTHRVLIKDGALTSHEPHR